MAKIGYKKDATDFNLKDENGGDYINDKRFSYDILERVDKIKFEEFGKTTDYKNWEKGRLFGEEAELKWHKTNNTNDEFHMVVITDEDFLPAGFCEFNCSNLRIVKHKDDKGNKKDREIFLWGEKDRGICSWFEPRIPQLLNYPVCFSEKRKRVKVVLREYQFEEPLPELKQPLTSTVYRFLRLIQDVKEED